MKLFVTAITIILSFSLAQAKNLKSDTSTIEPSEKVVLVTGFEAFDGEGVNPSYQAVTKLPDNIDGYKIIKKELPVSFQQSTKVLDKYIAKYNPRIILNIGQAGGRPSISLERVAINVDDARIPDNDGAKPINKTISKKGANAYFSKLPIYKIKKAINAKGIPVIISNSAGTYVCNHIMYELLNQLVNKYPNKIGGFIHVPYSTEQAVSKDSEPSMSIVNMTTAIGTAIKVSIKSLNDNG